MSRYAFSEAERWAVYKTHGGRCYICREPVDFASFEVDHVIPESLADDTEALQRALLELGLPPSFEVNSFENWLTSCDTCNGRKRELVWQPSLLVQRVLQQAAQKASTARAAAAASVTQRAVSRALGVLRAALRQVS